jgi:hypothetical protein
MESLGTARNVTALALWLAVSETAHYVLGKDTAVGATQKMNRALTTVSTRRNSVRKLSAALAGNSGTIDTHLVIIVVALANYLNQTRIVNNVGQVAGHLRTQISHSSRPNYVMDNS